MRTELIEYEKLRGDSFIKDGNITKMSKEIEKYKVDIENMMREKQAIIDEMKKIKAGYEVELRKKESVFEERIRDVRGLLEETLAKEKQSREEVGEVGKKYKKVGGV